jgi:ribonucleoside-diphosphate reductase alpha chain
MTNDPDVRFATSLVDYVFRRLAIDYLPPDKREALGIRSIDERKATAAAEAAEKLGTTVESIVKSVEQEGPPRLIDLGAKTDATHAADAPLCYSCGSKMQPAGSCYVCPSCGSTSGCS